jgi:RodZ C-terminal domain/PilZ domain
MERRTEPRFQVYSPAKVTDLKDLAHESECVLVDISAGGMKLVADENLSAGEDLCVETEAHLALAQVRHCVPRGGKFIIGAARVHSLSKLALPQGATRLDRIQALLDDHRRQLGTAPPDTTARHTDGEVVADAVIPPSQDPEGQSIRPEPAEPVILTADDGRGNDAVQETHHHHELTVETPIEKVSDTGTVAVTAPPPDGTTIEELGEARIRVDALVVLIRIATAAAPMRGRVASVSARSVRIHVETLYDDPPQPKVLYRVMSGDDVMLGEVSDCQIEGAGAALGFQVLHWFGPGDLERLIDSESLLRLGATVSPDRPQEEPPPPHDPSGAAVRSEDRAGEEVCCGVRAPPAAPELSFVSVKDSSGTCGRHVEHAAFGVTSTAEPTVVKTESAVVTAEATKVTLEPVVPAPVVTPEVVREVQPVSQPVLRPEPQTLDASAASKSARSRLLPVGVAAAVAILASAGFFSGRFGKSSQPPSPASASSLPTSSPTTNESVKESTHASIQVTAPAAPPATPSALVPSAAAVVPAVVAATVPGEHRVSITAHEDAWLSSCLDNKQQGGRLLAKGETRVVGFRQTAVVRVGNAAGVTMEIDGTPLGPLGEPKVARMIEFTGGNFRFLPRAAGNSAGDCGSPQ